MLTCNQTLTAFQRRTMQLIGVMMISCAGLNAFFPKIDRDHLSDTMYYAIAAIAVLPIIGTMVVIARYLTGEKDDYLRHIVVQSILWGFGLVMVLDTFLGYVIKLHSPHIPYLTAFNLEIFLVAAGIALRVQLWRNR